MLKLSVSSIGTYEKCPKKYHYRYIEKPDIEKVEWSHLEFGSCAHRALELFHLTLMKQKVDIQRHPILMKKCLKKAIKEFNQDLLRPEIPELQIIMQQYLDKLKKEGVPNTIGVELPFNIEIKQDNQSYEIRGFIDRLDKISEYEYEVVDYKTSKNPAYLDDFQLKVYALAVKEKYPDAKIISGTYTLLKHGCSPKTWKFTDIDLKDSHNHIIKVGALIETDKRWIKMPSRLCDWCDYKKICQETWV